MKNNNIKVYMHPRLCMHEHFDLFIKLFKYNCKILSCMCLVYYNMYKIQFVSNNFNILKVNDSTHEQWC
jgi:hypothetical protein